MIDTILKQIRAPVVRKKVKGTNITASKSGISVSTKIHDNVRVGLSPIGKSKINVKLGNGLKLNYKGKKPVSDKIKEHQAILSAMGLGLAVFNQVLKSKQR